MLWEGWNWLMGYLSDRLPSHRDQTPQPTINPYNTFDSSFIARRGRASS